MERKPTKLTEKLRVLAGVAPLACDREILSSMFAAAINWDNVIDVARALWGKHATDVAMNLFFGSGSQVNCTNRFGVLKRRVGANGASPRLCGRMPRRRTRLGLALLRVFSVFVFVGCVVGSFLCFTTYDMSATQSILLLLSLHLVEVCDSVGSLVSPNSFTVGSEVLLAARSRFLGIICPPHRTKFSLSWATKCPIRLFAHPEFLCIGTAVRSFGRFHLLGIGNAVRHGLSPEFCSVISVVCCTFSPSLRPSALRLVHIRSGYASHSHRARSLGALVRAARRTSVRQPDFVAG